MNKTEMIEEENSQRSLYTDRSQSSDYKGETIDNTETRPLEHPKRIMNTLKTV